MKTNRNKRLLAALLVLLIIVLAATPALAASKMALNVRVEAYLNDGSSVKPYKNVQIQLGKTTKATGSNGTTKFRLENIPATTMVMLSAADPTVPSGIHMDLYFSPGPNEYASILPSGPITYDINLTYTQNTNTVVIELLVDKNHDYALNNLYFEKKAASQQPQQPQQP